MMKTYRWIVIAFLILALAIPAMPASAQQLVNLQLTSPKPNPATWGSEITFDLAVVASQDSNPPLPNPRGVSGIDLYLSYNPLIVTPPTTPGSTAVEVLPDFFGVANISVNEVLQNGPCFAAGGVPVAPPCVHAVVAGPPQASQSGIAVRFHFRVLTSPPPNAPISAIFTITSAVVMDDNGSPVGVSLLPGPTFPPCAAPGQGVLCVPIQTREVKGLVARQGIPAGVSLSCASVTATAVNGGWKYGPILTDATGTFRFNNLPAGTYYFRASYPGYLDSVKVNVAVPDNSLSVDLGKTLLVGGDVNTDAKINILDIGKIISKFNQLASLSCPDPSPEDINDNGVVNIGDLAIAAGNWNFTPTIIVPGEAPGTPWRENPWAP